MAGTRRPETDASTPGRQRPPVTLNGVQTVVMHDGKFAAGPIALQYGPGVQGVQGGTIKWRRPQVKAL